MEEKGIMKLLLLFLSISLCAAQRELGTYNVQLNDVSVSGISSGAAFATQVHVAYSQFVKGVGMIAGVPYWCAKNNVLTATTTCMTRASNVNVQDLISQANSYASSGRISATINMFNDPVFIFHGTLDSAVDPDSAPNVRSFYAHYGANIAEKLDLAAEHGQPTEDYGVACHTQGGSYINRCNYDAAYYINNHINGGLEKPTSSTPQPGDFYEFDQSEFFHVSTPGMWSMARTGYVYVPTACQQGAACKVHIVFHGCGQNSEFVNTEFARETGYNEVGELNNIIMLYPQTANSLALPTNPFGCWDWWGYNLYSGYATQDGHQVLAICRMVQKITGKNASCPNEP